MQQHLWQRCSSPILAQLVHSYDKNFLISLIKEPTKALKVEHKFNETKPHPMIAFFGLGGDIDQEVADIVAYLQSIAPKELDNKKFLKMHVKDVMI